jgi:aspartate/methionine/tyrosine aminotransferase
LPDWVAKYADFSGQVQFKTTLAKLMQKYWVKKEVQPEEIAIQAGCGSIIESLCWLLANQGDSVILPGPIYPNFFVDSFNRCQLNMEVAKTSQDNDFEITTEILQSAYQNSIANGSRPKILLLCQPCNPTGKLYSREELSICISFAERYSLHVISDEIYALSMMPGCKMLSMAQIETTYDKIHIIGGLSKDFGVSGFRVGILYT